MINKKNLNDKNKSDETYRTDPPQGQPGIPDPPKLFDVVESFGFDLSWRPTNYFQDLTLEQKLGSKIKGQIRGKKVIGDIRDQPVHPELMKSELASDLKDIHGKIHPSMMGGEYLPDFYENNEIEICRVVSQSTTMDVQSLRVRKQKHRYAYRIVDEYSNYFDLPQKTSVKTLTMKQVINILNNCQMRFYDSGDEWEYLGIVRPYIEHESSYLEFESKEELLDFASVESMFYPEIEEYYENQKLAWVEEFGINY